MRTSPTASLLVAALVMLRRPCARNKATAQLLLERAAEHSELTPAEREACLNLAEDLDIERPEPALIRTPRPAAPLLVKPQGADRGCIDANASTTTLTGRGAEHSRRLSLVPGLSFAPDTEGAPARLHRVRARNGCRRPDRCDGSGRPLTPMP
ncbi:MAG: hypothetical protein LT080_08585 [Thiobacillus sp.]|nr:hypothetical protein [Thiobacillus sp.]